MKVSLRWLKDYVDIDIAPSALADRLTMAGLEVDAVEEYTPAFTGVVTAKILSMKPHPGADKLHLLEVTTGEQVLPIVCGAQNMKAGDVVALATVGATIPGGYSIKSSKIRGEASEGMLCSEDELGIGPDASGIMILPARHAAREQSHRSPGAAGHRSRHRNHTQPGRLPEHHRDCARGGRSLREETPLPRDRLQRVFRGNFAAHFRTRSWTPISVRDTRPA